MDKKLKKFKYIFFLKKSLSVVLTTFMRNGFYSKVKHSYLKKTQYFLKKYLKSPVFSEITVDLNFDMVASLMKIKVFFKFSFHTINKKIRKYSRGKSGKYKLEMSYLPFYKRFNFVLSLLKKNYKVVSHLKLGDAFLFLKHLVNFNLKKSLVFKLIGFINSYILKRKYNSSLLNSH